MQGDLICTCCMRQAQVGVCSRAWPQVLGVPHCRCQAPSHTHPSIRRFYQCSPLPPLALGDDDQKSSA